MTKQTQAQPLPNARVATRHGTGGVAEQRRRIYQRHLLLFLGVNLTLLGVDYLTSPEIQFGHFLAAPWLLLFLAHTFGLKSRGYSFFELFIPPRQKPVKDVYTTPLDYETVRVRQLRDGVVSAAAAIREQHGSLADEVTAAADELVAALEAAVAADRASNYARRPKSSKLLPEAQTALNELDRLHQAVIAAEVLEDAPAELPVQAVRDRAAALRDLAG